MIKLKLILFNGLQIPLQDLFKRHYKGFWALGRVNIGSGGKR